MGYHRAGWYTPRWVDRWIWHIDNPDRPMPCISGAVIDVHTSLTTQPAITISDDSDKSE